ncbi:MAG: 2Fe-2S iron-sulfur cluster binding domain-containing protein [Deltaproteobacteria bacterium]|nr:2Fe-2S iron-sulfur cluster binding domain-containing protein [Deltaproteobacteria bacterium]
MALTVEFKRSQKTAEWQDRFENILELAEHHGIEIDSDCQQGFCGTCKIELLSGDVHMEVTDGLEAEDMKQNMILPCVARPTTDIVINV